MKIGWLADSTEYDGGAQISDREILAAAPVEIVPMPVDGVTDDVDGYVLHNVATYAADKVIPFIKNKPFVKLMSDLWPTGDPALREFVLHNAALLTFNSPLARRKFPFRVTAPQRIIIKAAIDPARFKPSKRKRNGAVWLGRPADGKGFSNANTWAERHNTTLDTYIHMADVFLPPLMTVKGPIDYEDVPKTLARYETFVFLPDDVDTYSRSTVEAWLAGCKLEVNHNVGALHWIRHAPEKILGDVAGELWKAILDAIQGRPDVSVIVPCYNCEATAEKAIRSALDQQGVRVEVIAVNAASPDNVADVLRAIDDPRLHILTLDSDPGLGASNNLAIEQATGRYFHYLEGDDYLEPGCLAPMAQTLDAYPRVGFVYGSVQYHGQRTDRFVPYPFNRADFWQHNASLYPVMWRSGMKARWHDFAAGIGKSDRDFILQLVKESDGMALPHVLVLHYNFVPSGAWHKAQAYDDALTAELHARHPELKNGASEPQAEPVR